ncbi:MAG: ornithine cyclodeaminase family protein [Chlamydiae bacterium]|nr:ornithine cyclodeaminase family protein [Chlamydiota bacterium]MBI3278069.1 ornithine cyclodeaminase family protein [Chlamydiota bacterium]
MKTLLLTSQDLTKLMDEDDAFQVMQEVFRSQGEGRVQMPPKIYLDLKKYEGDFRAMPAYVETPEACGLKWVNSHPNNILKGLFPAVMGILILSDPQTGFPLSILDGTLITRLRTGASGSLASFYLAKPDSKVLALVGCGVQAQAQFQAHLKHFQFLEVRVWAPEEHFTNSFKAKMASFHSNIIPCQRLEDCVQSADILCTTTPSRTPLIRKDWLKRGVHINAMGADAPGKQELETNILKEAFFVVDEIEQSLHGGEANVPFREGILAQGDIDGTLGEIVCGKKWRQNQDEITVFDSTGLAIQDVSLGFRAYQKALKRKMGQWIEFF